MSLAPTLDPLGIRSRLGRHDYRAPTSMGEGSNTWIFDNFDGDARIIVTCSDMPWIEPNRFDWVHASISRRKTDPSYADMVLMHKAVWPAGWAYQVFAAPSDHVNIHPHALHLWGTLSGEPLLPNFGAMGSI